MRLQNSEFAKALSANHLDGGIWQLQPERMGQNGERNIVTDVAFIKDTLNFPTLTPNAAVNISVVAPVLLRPPTIKPHRTINRQASG